MKKVATLILILMVSSLLMYGCNTAFDKATTDKAIEVADKAGDSMITWIADNGTANDLTDDTILYTVKIIE